MANIANSFNVGDDGLSFGENTLTGIFSDTFDPSTGTGQAAPIGSLFLYSGGTLFIKTAASNTGWTPIEATVSAGLGLYYTAGNTLNVSSVNDSRLTVSTQGVDLATTGISGGTYTKITVDQYGRAVIGGYISSLDVTTALGYTPEPQNANLDALAATATTGLYSITGTGTSSTVQIVVPDGMSIANPDGVAGNPTISLTNNLLSIENLNTNGLTVNTNGGGFSTVTLVSTSSGLTITNPDGTTGNPTFSLSGDIGGIEDISGTGIAVRTAASTWATTSILGTSNQIIVANGDGVAGSPTISLAPNTVIPGVGALTIPAGSDADRPGSPSAGMIRWSTTSTVYEGWDTYLNAWDAFASQTWVSNNYQPLAANLTALANYAIPPNSAGLYTITGNGSSSTTEVVSPNGTITVTNGNGYAGNIGVDINPSWPGSASIVTVGNITTGNWQAGTISTSYGGTGLSSIGNSNQLLGVNSTGNALEYKTVNQGSGISLSFAAGSITISNSGVVSLGSGTGISVSQSTGNVTVSNTGVTSLTSAGGSISLSATTGDITVTGPELYNENPQPGFVAPAATGNNAVAIGYGAIAQADKSLAIGEQAMTQIAGGVVQASGRFVNSGDAQAGRYMVRCVTVGTYPTEAFVDGTNGSVRLVLPDNTTWTFRAMVTAQGSNPMVGHAGYEIKGVIYRVNGASSVAIQGAPSYEQFASSNQAWSVLADADMTNGSLRFTFTGDTAGSILKWVALVETVEVTG